MTNSLDYYFVSIFYIYRRQEQVTWRHLRLVGQEQVTWRHLPLVVQQQVTVTMGQVTWCHLEQNKLAPSNQVTGNTLLFHVTLIFSLARFVLNKV